MTIREVQLVRSTIPGGEDISRARRVSLACNSGASRMLGMARFPMGWLQTPLEMTDEMYKPL